MRNRIAIAAFIFSQALLTPTTGLSQGILVVPNAGFSKDMRSLTSNRWKWGFNAGVDGYLHVSEIIFVGARVSYHNWSMDAEGWAEDVLSASTGIQNSSGSESVVEVIPSLRIALLPPASPIRVDLQVGGGLIFVSHTEVRIRRRTFSGWEESVASARSMVGTGLQAALPITLASVIEVLPVYTLYAAGGDPYHHIALNVGVAFNK